MANIGDLEVFRQKWREELTKKQSVEREVDDGGNLKKPTRDSITKQCQHKIQ